MNKTFSNKFLLALLSVFASFSFAIVADAQEQLAMQFVARPMTALDAAHAGIDVSGGLIFSDRTFDAGATYIHIPSASLSYVGLDADYRLSEKMAFSLDGAYGKGKPYDTFNESGIKTGSYTPGELYIKLGAAYRFMDSMAARVRVGYLKESLAEGVSYTALAVDAALNGCFVLSESTEVLAEAGVYNLGSAVKSKSGLNFSIPASAGLGGGLCQELGAKLDMQILARLDYYFHGAVAASIGGDFCFADLLSLRAGYRYGGKSVIPSFVSLGLGVKFAGVRLDLAYLTASPLSNTLALGLGYSF